MLPDELSDTGLYIPQRPKQVNLSTEVVKGVGIEVVHDTRGTKGSTEMWYRGWYRNTHTHYYSYITTYFFYYYYFFFFLLFFFKCFLYIFFFNRTNVYWIA